MSTNYYDDEHTRYNTGKPSGRQDDEATQFDSGVNDYNKEEGTQLDSQEHSGSGENASSGSKGKKQRKWATVAAGAGAGIIMGSGAALLSSFTSHPDDASEHTPDWVDDKVPVAHTVNDNMSFHDAFDAARAEVGSGGVFEWHGYIYSTYTEDEWNSMSQAEREEFGNHFDWKGGAPDNNDDVAVVAHEGGSAHNEPAPASHHEQHDTAEVASHDDAHVEQAHTGDDDHASNGYPAPDTEDDQEIEILGVTHDEESGMDIASATVGGHGAVIVDVDGDDIADVFGVDVNNDHEFGTGEMVDISGENIHMSSLGGVSATTDDYLTAETDAEPDYSNPSDDAGV